MRLLVSSCPSVCTHVSEWLPLKKISVKFDFGDFCDKVYVSSKWWEVKDWDESVSELMIVKKQLQETVHSTVLLGCFYLLYML